jgi:hypothetical protein
MLVQVGVQRRPPQRVVQIDYDVFAPDDLVADQYIAVVSHRLLIRFVGNERNVGGEQFHLVFFLAVAAVLGLLGVLLLSPSPARVVSVGMLAVGTVLALVVGAGMARQADQRER